MLNGADSFINGLRSCERRSLRSRGCFQQSFHISLSPFRERSRHGRSGPNHARHSEVCLILAQEHYAVGTNAAQRALAQSLCLPNCCRVKAKQE